MTITKVEFDPDRNNIESLFKGAERLEVPRYQRSYAWTKKEVEDFYNDFVVDSILPEDNFDFIGTILFSIDKDKGTLEIIDGQQRLLAITLFFAAVRDVLRFEVATETSIDFSKDIHNDLIRTGSGRTTAYLNNSNYPFRIKVGKELESIFEKIVQNNTDDYKDMKPKTAPEKRVFESYIYFRSKIKESISSLKFEEYKIQIIERKLARVLGIQFIDIRVHNNEVAYNLFESHNAKGQDLEKTDLIKNFYFGRLPANQDKTSKMDEWDNLINLLSENTKGQSMPPDRFFNYMIQSYEGNFSSSHLYRRIKPIIEDTSKFSSLMKININSMIDLKNANTDDKIANSSLYGIDKYLGVSQCYIFLLALYRNRKKITANSFQKIIKAVENFSYIYSAVCSQPTNVLEKVYSRFAKQLEDDAKTVKENDLIESQKLGGRLLSSISKELDSLMPSKDMFAESFNKLSYDNFRERDLIRYTFNKIEEINSSGLIQLGNEFTLDHIIPQKLSNNNNKKCLSSIGNLVPLAKVTNSKLGSSLPSEKIETYKDNRHLKTVEILLDQFGDNGQFDQKSITDRTAELAKIAYDKVFLVK